MIHTEGTGRAKVLRQDIGGHFKEWDEDQGVWSRVSDGEIGRS